MGTESYRFKIGNFDCIVVNDGFSECPADFLFANAPKEPLEQMLRKHNLQPDKIVDPNMCLVINTGEHRILVDTGFGAISKQSPVAQGAGRLLQNLQVEGLQPKDFDIVILTHGDFDHIGGNIDSEGNPVFPNARFYMWRDEWKFRTSEPAMGQDYLVPIKDQFTLLDHEGEILPGIQVILAPGHSLGHMALMVSSGGEKLLHVCDAVGHPINIEHPD